MLRRPNRRCIATVLMPVLWAAFVVTAPAASAQSARSTKDASFEDQFWKYIVGNNYKNWSPGFSGSAGFYKGDNPHGEYLKIYVNRTAAGNVDDLALGSVVILENYRKDQSLKTISVMYRTTGFNPAANDWYWIEYRPDGSVVRPATNAEGAQNAIRNVSLTTAPKRMVMGKSANCIQCHQSAAGDDFVFSNDQYSNQPKQQYSARPKDQPSARPKDQPSGQSNDLFGERVVEHSDEQFEYLQGADDALEQEANDADFVADSLFGSR